MNIADPLDPTVVIIAGDHKDGKPRIFIDLRDLHEILLINNILGGNGLLEKIQNAHKEELKANKRIDYKLFQDNIDNAIYETLQKYFYQMLNAVIGRTFLPEIIPLEKHKDYFKKEVADAIS